MSDLTIYTEVEPGSIVPGIRRPVREDHPALVPSLVALADVGQIDASLAVASGCSVLQKVHATLEPETHRRVSVVP